MRLKRIFWLTCAAAIVSWLIWMRLRQRRDEFAASTPHFAPPSTFAPYTPTAPSAPPPAEIEAAAPATTLTDLDEATDAPAAEPLPDLDHGSSALVEAQEPLPDLGEASAAAPEAAVTDTALPPASTTSADVPADQAKADVAAEADTEISGYCMRCKTKRPIQDAHRETTESGRPAARGTCPVCGANMFTFLATDDV